MSLPYNRPGAPGGGSCCRAAAELLPIKSFRPITGGPPGENYKVRGRPNEACTEEWSSGGGGGGGGEDGEGGGGNHTQHGLLTTPCRLQRTEHSLIRPYAARG